MGIIKEPKGVDFIIQSPPPTTEEIKEISDFIKMRKAQKATEEKALKAKKAKTKDEMRLDSAIEKLRAGKSFVKDLLPG